MPSYIVIKEESKVPKYRQIVDSIMTAIENRTLKVNDRLPSVNELLVAFDISRDTVVHAYEYLKKIKVIESVPGKGFYVINDQLALKARIFLIFNKLSPHKKIIFDSFAKTLGDKATIDFFVYNNSFRHFKDLLLEGKKRNYTHFVVICHFEEGGYDILNFLKDEIPPEKLVVLDKRIEGLSDKAASVYQDFENNIYTALIELNPSLKKYKKIGLLLRKKTYHPAEIKKGFIRFCGEFAYEYEVINQPDSLEIEKNTAYINLQENDLVILLKKLSETKFRLGSDVGIISYNDTPIKEILRDGITVISTDFENLGSKAARLILEKETRQIENPFYVIPRKSL